MKTLKSFLEDSRNKNTVLRYSVIILLIISFLVILLFYLSPLQSYSKNIDAETVIYFADNITEAHRLIINLFNKENKGRIRVEAINLDHHKLDTNKRKELIFRNLRSERSKIDIFTIDNIWLPRFAKWAEPLDRFFAEDVIEKILPELQGSCYYDHTLYAFPLFYDLGVLFYRQDLIDKLPNAAKWEKKLNEGITWHDLYELKKNYFKNKPVYVFQAKAYEGLICNYLEIGAGLGRPVFQKDAFLLNETNIARVNSFVKDIIYNKKIVPSEVIQFDEASSFLYALKNDIPLMRAWVTNINNMYFLEKYRDKVNNLQMAPLPSKEGNGHALALGGWNLIISKYSRNKKEAARFLKFISSNQVQSELFNAGFFLPIFKDVRFQKNSVNAKMIKPFTENWIKYSIRRPVNKNYTRLSDIYSTLINRALRGQINVDEVYPLAMERIVGPQKEKSKN